MLTRLMDAHIKLANGKVILLLLFLFLLTNFVIVPAVYPKFQTLDTLSSYTPGKAYELISSYGEQGRKYYAGIEASLDVFYPFITALMFSLMTLYTFRHAFPNKHRVLYIAFTSYVVMLADYLENICILFLLIGYPREMFTIARAANFFTMTKFILTPMQLLCIVGLAGWLIREIISRYSSKPVHKEA
jgi:hypothetical protein